MPLKLAFLGAWHGHASMHVREAAQRPDEFSLLGLYDPEEAARTKLLQTASAAGIALETFPTPAALLDSSIDAVIIEGHIYQNLAYAELALNAGKHVLLEKPAGVDIPRLKRLHALAQSKSLQLHMAYMWRYNPAVARMLHLGTSGALGELFFFRGHIPKPLSFHPSLAQEFKVYRGGVYFEMAGHLVDMMVILMGEPHTVTPTLAPHFGSEVDNAVVVHQFDKGLGTVDTGAMYAAQARRIEVHGTGGGAIHAPIGSNNLEVALGEGGQWQAEEINPNPDAPSLLRELAACIRGDKEPDFSLHHDMAVQRTLFAGCDINDGQALKEKPPTFA